MSGPLTVDEVAYRSSVGLVVVQDRELHWLNDAAQALVVPHGGSWSGPDSPLGLLREVRVSARRAAVRWPSPVGGTRWWQVTRPPLRGHESAVLYEITDETARHRDGTRNAEWKLARLESMAGMGSWEWETISDRMIWSDTLLHLAGLPPGTRMNIATFRSLLHPDDARLVEETFATALRTTQPFTYSHRIYLPDRSSIRHFECYGEVFTDAGGAPMRLLGAARDVTEQRQAREELAYLAEHDPLTGVSNRRRITTRLAECAAAATASTLLLLDVDNFKDINDLRGHAVGDRVMRSLARSVSAQIGPDALLGRLGGDEFAVVVPDCDARSGVELAERLCDTVGRTPVVDAGAALRVTVSIGVATVAAGQDAEASLAQADLALYEAKNAGRNRVRLFATDHYDQAVRRVSVLQRVSDALESGTMELDAQPIVDLATGVTGRYELLIRLRDGLDPVLGPAEFLPAAERGDLVLRLDRWVLERALEALAAPRARAQQLRFEVNVSARSLEDPALGGWVLDRLAQANVEPGRLGLEITETAAISSLDAARSLAIRLTAAGCGFSLDDFGAGFGSFSYLKHLPFTAVKIAGEFVRQLDADRVDRALVTAVVGVAQELGMTTVAEQVERQELVDTLRELGVDRGQGYHLGRPRPLAELLADE